MDDLDSRAAFLTKAPNLIERERRMPAIDMANDVGARFKNDILVDQAGTGT